MVMLQCSPSQRTSWTAADRASLLSRVRSFAKLPAAVRADIVRSAFVKRVHRGEFVFIEGDPLTTVSILAEGRVKVIQETTDGHEIILRLIRPGELFGIIGSWNESRYRVSAVAQENVVIQCVPWDVFVALLGTYPAFALAVLEELGSRLGDAETRIGALQTEHAARRLARMLLRLAKTHRA